MIKLAVPDIGEEEFQEIKRVLDSKYLVQGEEVEKFEQMVSEYLNVKNCIAVSSGTAALHVALIALEIKNNHEVIVPDFTFPATANVVELIGASTKFVDIKLDSFCIDENKIEEKITEKTKAIIPVHEFGQSADMDKIMDIAKRYNLRVIEDAACALGTNYNGKMVGTFGDIGCFSFHPRKAITTGEGGMIVTNNDELAEKIRAIRNHGISCVNGKSEFIFAGFNYRMTNIQAALGVVQMKKLNNIINQRRLIAEKYNELLKNAPNLITPIEKKYGMHTYQTYHILLSYKIDRDLLKEKLKENGIETNLGAYAVHHQQYYKEKYNYDDKLFKNSLTAYKQGLALPVHCQLDAKKLTYICDCIKDVVK